MKKNKRIHTKQKGKPLEIKLANVPVNEMMKVGEIKNNTQIYQWVKWYQEGEVHRITTASWKTIQLWKRTISRRFR